VTPRQRAKEIRAALNRGVGVYADGTALNTRTASGSIHNPRIVRVMVVDGASLLGETQCDGWVDLTKIRCEDGYGKPVAS